MAAKLTPGEPKSAAPEVRTPGEAELAVSAALAELAAAQAEEEGKARPRGRRRQNEKHTQSPGPALKKRRGIQCVEVANDQDPEAAHPAPNLASESAGRPAAGATAATT